MAQDPTNPFVSRGGLKLAAALDAFQIDPAGLVCADLGCNVGGFTDCLLQRGAALVFAVDTAYGELAWKLRQDPRVTVMERTNALHIDPASACGEGFDLVVIDLGWTRQRLAIPAALRWLRRSPDARIISLIKPHYEAGGWDERIDKHTTRRHVLSDDEAESVCRRVLDEMPAMGLRVLSHIRSPIRGGGKRGGKGNIEFLALLARDA